MLRKPSQIIFEQKKMTSRIRDAIFFKILKKRRRNSAKAMMPCCVDIYASTMILNIRIKNKMCVANKKLVNSQAYRNFVRNRDF